MKHNIGNRYGHLTLIEKLPSRKIGKSRKIFWLCRCELCNSIKEYQSNNVTVGNSKTCGCQRGKNLSMRVKKPLGYSNANNTYGNYKRSAKDRNLKFLLTLDDFILISQQNCHFCGCKPSQVSNVKDKFGKPRCNGAFIYNGIDRKNNNDGYTLEGRMFGKDEDSYADECG